MQTPVYFDYAATTPVDPVVAQAMTACLTLDGTFGNPASRSHLFGWKAEEAVENARRDVADLIGADPREIVWTSGATESDNLAIKGVVEHFRAEHPETVPHIISSAIEHKAVVDTCEYLAATGAELTMLKPGADGLITVAQVADALRPNTVLVSLMHVNNELGNITDIAAIADLCRSNNIIYHIDASQSVGKIEIDLRAVDADLLSLSAHKFYGPKGAGALFVRRRVSTSIAAQMHGGGHERGLRSGTLATHQIVGLGAAAARARQVLTDDAQRLSALRTRLLDGVMSDGAARLNSHSAECVPGIVNICFPGVDGETLLIALNKLAVSSGSACTSASVAPSYVLAALGLSDADALSSLRFSMGRYTTEAEVDFAIAEIRRTLAQLQG